LKLLTNRMKLATTMASVLLRRQHFGTGWQLAVEVKRRFHAGMKQISVSSSLVLSGA
jgi:hypothetical protein